MKKLLPIALIALLFTGCYNAQFFTPVDSDLARVSSEYPGTSLADLQKGMELYQGNCGKCHALKKPTSKSVEQWNNVVPRMVKKVNKKEEKLSVGDQDLILRYVVTMSGKVKSKN